MLNFLLGEINDVAIFA